MEIPDAIEFIRSWNMVKSALEGNSLAKAVLSALGVKNAQIEKMDKLVFHLPELLKILNNDIRGRAILDEINRNE